MVASFMKLKVQYLTYEYLFFFLLHNSIAKNAGVKRKPVFPTAQENLAARN